MKNNKELFFLLILTITLSLTIVPVKSNQQIDFKNYIHFNVKKGDSMHYRFTHINSSNKNYIVTGYQQPNGTFSSINLTTNQEIIEIVTDVNTTINPNTVKYHAYLSKTSSDNKLGRFIPAPIINIAFDNNSIFQQYIDWFNQTNHIPLIYDQNYIYYNTSYGGTSPSNPMSVITVAFNWHTGWLEYFDFKTQDVYGNEITGIHFERVQENILMNLPLLLVLVYTLAL